MALQTSVLSLADLSHAMLDASADVHIGRTVETVKKRNR
jgi:hypothetical protein